MEVGFIQMCLALHDGRQVRYRDLFQALHNGPSFLIAQLIYFVMVMVGLALFILPGAYLGTRDTFYAFPYSKGRINLKQSFQESANFNQHMIWSLFWFLFLILLFNIAGASILGIGLMVTIPMSVVMKVHVYHQLNDG